MTPTSTAGNLTDSMATTRNIPRYRAHGGYQRGFTLMELAIVILLISLFTIISVPLLSTGTKSDLNASTRRLAGTMKYLFNEAALSGQEHRLVFNLDENRYHGEIVDADGSISELEENPTHARLKDGIAFTDIVLAGEGSFTKGEVSVRIHPSGWLEETVIHLSDEKKNSLTLRVNPLTGSSEVFTGYREFQLN